MSSAPKFVAGAIAFALIGGVLLLGPIRPSTTQTPAPVGATSPSPVASEEPSPTLSPSPMPTLAAEPSPATPALVPDVPMVPVPGGDAAVYWQTPWASLKADRIRIKANDLTFKGVESPLLDYSTNDPEMEVTWREHDREMRLKFYLGANKTHWWIDEIRTYDGKKDGEWLYYKRLADRTRTPKGKTLKWDVALTPNEVGRRDRKNLKEDASLRVDGLRLRAFAPGTEPAPLEVTGCSRIPKDWAVLVEVDPVVFQGTRERVTEAIDHFAPGTPMEGIDLLPPAEASERLTELGICHEFSYAYDFADQEQDRGLGYSERWCTMPDVVRPEEPKLGDEPIVDARGKMRRGRASVRDGVVRLLVVDLEPRSRRAQPPAGWNCPTE